MTAAISARRSDAAISLETASPLVSAFLQPSQVTDVNEHRSGRAAGLYVYMGVEEHARSQAHVRPNGTRGRRKGDDSRLKLRL